MPQPFKLITRKFEEIESITRPPEQNATILLFYCTSSFSIFNISINIFSVLRIS